MMTNNDNRKYPRFDASNNIAYNFMYDFESSLELSATEKDLSHKKFNALTQNVSLEGLCFITEHVLKEGDELNLDVYVQGDKQPVHMQGCVCWCCPEKGSFPQKFKTGVRVTDIEGVPVKDTVRYDEQYHVYWSDVLESILGKFRILQQKKNGAS